MLRRYAIAFAALCLLLSGSAYAVAGQINGGGAKQLYACVTSDFHTLNLTRAAGSCPAGESKISWDAAGRRGPRGATGAAGSAGARGVPGARGTKGATGATGAQGDAGAVGPQGVTGPKGDTGAAGPIGPAGVAGVAGADAVTNFAEFYALMPPDNPATVAAGTSVAFPRDGPQSAAAAISRVSSDTFNLQNVGVYRIAFNVPITGLGQLELTVNDSPLAYTVTGQQTQNSPIAGEALVQTTTPNDLLTVNNPAGEPQALTVTNLAGGHDPTAATLTIEQLG